MSESRSEFEERVAAQARQRWETEGAWTRLERVAAEEAVAGKAAGEPAYSRRQWEGTSGGRAGETAAAGMWCRPR